MPAYIPHLIPVVDPLPATPAPTGSDPSTFFSFDVAVGGLGFRLANDSNTPVVWETAPYVKQRTDQAAEAGEQTLTNWWVKSQASFHGGAGNLNLERVDLPPEYTHIRFDQSKNCDVWTPGKVTRLPDTTHMVADETVAMVGVSIGGDDYAVYVDASGDLIRLDPSGPTTDTFTDPVDILAITTDGKTVYAAGENGLWRVNPANTGSSDEIATFAASPSTSVAVEWVKGRLMLAVDNTIYEVDTTVVSPVVLTAGGAETRYTHPQSGWVWRCFAESPNAILAAGDAGLRSDIVVFQLASDGSTPVLAVGGTAGQMPDGERVLSMENAMGSFLAIGTTAGLRVAALGNTLYEPTLTWGPLTLPATEPSFAVSALAARDRFVYFGGVCVDEPGLLRVDLGTQTDQAGRRAYATDLLAPDTTGTGTVTAVCVLPSGKLLFSVPSFGLCLEGTGPGSGREAWLRTSRIRYGTTEPKLFKLGRVRGDLASSSVKVDSITRDSSTTSATVGFTLDEPDEFGLPAGRQEWLALKFTLNGSTGVFAGYGVKALPGTKRQRMVQVVCAVMDRESDRSGHRHVDLGSARTRVEALYDLDAAGDEVLFEEFGIYGVHKTLVVIDKVTFVEDARPTPTSDFGGKITMTLRTVT